jgi:hypothetical protein
MSIPGAAHYNAFYLAYSLNLVLSGVVGAIGSATLAPVARLGATGDRFAMVQALTYLPMLIALSLVTALFGMRLAMPLLVTHWSHGIAGAGDVNAYLFLLGFQTIARSLSVVFGIVLASRATALRLVGPSLLELAVVLLVAVPLGSFFGERAFLLALGGAGLTAALALAVVGILVAGLDRSDRRRVMLRFAITEGVALAAWWLLAIQRDDRSGRAEPFEWSVSCSPLHSKDRDLYHRLMKTTLDIKDQLLADAKALAAQQRTSLMRVIEQGLQLRLRSQVAPQRGKLRLPIFKGRGGLVAGVDSLSNKAMLAALGDDT